MKTSFWTVLSHTYQTACEMPVDFIPKSIEHTGKKNKKKKYRKFMVEYVFTETFHTLLTS